MVDDLPADVLKRTHPVPISRQSIEAQSYAFCGPAIYIETFVNKVRISRRA
jgi:hypothetical protein